MGGAEPDGRQMLWGTGVQAAGSCKALLGHVCFYGETGCVSHPWGPLTLHRERKADR